MISSPPQPRAQFAIAATAAVGLVSVVVIAARLSPWAAILVVLCATVLATLIQIFAGKPTHADESWRSSVENKLAASQTSGTTILRVKYSDPAEAADMLADLLLDARAVAASERAQILGLLDGVADPVIATDESGVVVLANAGAASFFSGRGLAILGRNVEDVFTQLDAVALHRKASIGEPASGLIRFVREESARLFEVTATPRRGTATSEPMGGELPRVGVVLTLRDVTELATAAQLKTDFVANASHELRTPLAAIKGAVETLQSGAKDEPAMCERFIEMIGTSAARLEELTRDLLDLSRLESPETAVRITTIDAQSFFDSLVAQFDHALKARSLTLDVDIAPRCRTIRSDPRLLEVVLRNLVENATKFAYLQTTVRVVVVPGPVPGSLRCQVIDQGLGIPIDQQQRIFERFYQVDSSRQGNGPKGTGLGLAIVKYALKSLGGVIRVDSVWKQGTTMTIDLPQALVSGV